MPAWLRNAMVISPLHHYMDASFGILLKGCAMDLIGNSGLSLAILGTAIFAFGAWKFRSQLS